MSAEQMRKAFEAWYVADAARQGVEIDAEHMLSIRKGNTYGKDRTLLNGKWEGWQAALATQPQAPQGAVTPGFRLLPIEPTMEMYEAAGEELYGYSREKSVEWAKEDKFESSAQTGMEAWRVMVKAAPKTPEVQK